MTSDSPSIPKNTCSEPCPKCQEHLVPGKAFVQPARPVQEYTTDCDFSATLVDCQKCPNCGYSELPRDHEFAGAVGSEVRFMGPAALAHYQVFGGAGLKWDRVTNQYVVDDDPQHPPSLK